MDRAVEEALKKLSEEYIQVTLLQIANKVGRTPEETKKPAFRFAPKYGVEIGEKSILKKDISIAQ